MALEKLQVKIGGMACSFCVETIKKGLGRIAGVAEVNVSLAHEEALIAHKAAAQAGEIVIEHRGVVANMPLVTWPGGSR